MDEHGYFDLEVLKHSKLMDDALMGLACYAAITSSRDFPQEHNVLAVNWRRLPMPVEELVLRGKKIVHPIKDDDVSIEWTACGHTSRRDGPRATGTALWHRRHNFELRLAFRRLLKSPFASTIAISVAPLGIGANAAMYPKRWMHEPNRGCRSSDE